MRMITSMSTLLSHMHDQFFMLMQQKSMPTKHSLRADSHPCSKVEEPKGKLSFGQVVKITEGPHKSQVGLVHLVVNRDKKVDMKVHADDKALNCGGNFTYLIC